MGIDRRRDLNEPNVSAVHQAVDALLTKSIQILPEQHLQGDRSRKHQRGGRVEVGWWWCRGWEGFRNSIVIANSTWFRQEVSDREAKTESEVNQMNFTID